MPAGAVVPCHQTVYTPGLYFVQIPAHELGVVDVRHERENPANLTVLQASSFKRFFKHLRRTTTAFFLYARYLGFIQNTALQTFHCFFVKGLLHDCQHALTRTH